MSTKYRPWGLLTWVLDQCEFDDWGLLSCIGTEDRSLSAWKNLNSFGKLSSVTFIRIIDKPSKHTVNTQNKNKVRERELVALGGDAKTIRDYDLLMTSHDEIVSIAKDFLATSGPNVILDVTSMPKRFFFPILKILMNKRSEINNLIVTYSFPESYLDGKLAENCNDYAHLPLFSGEYGVQKSDMLIAGVGFEVYGLQEQVEQGGSGIQVKLLLPFPAPSKAFNFIFSKIKRLH